MRVGILIVLMIFASVFANAAQEGKPKVVMGIVVENMRPDYIQRFWDKFGENGFKKLYQQGAVCTNVHLTQHIQNYATGTATLFSGVNPSIHGIIDKTWFDRLKNKEVECTDDDNYFTVGADTKAGNASPVNLMAMTITDNLKIFTQGKSKVFSAAINRETAIFSAGHAADAAYWFDVESGRMISSSFYVNTFPDWVRIFNSENYAEMYSYRTWTTLLPEATYTESTRDDYLLERGYFGEYNTFPHSISKYLKRTGDFRPFKTTPSANLMIKDFVLQMLANEDIGTDDNTDFITATFTSMDYENGSFGPASLEMEDTYLYMDKYIGELIDSTEERFGKDNVLFFLVGNTSASYPVEYLKEEFHLQVDYFNIESAIALLNSFLNITYGDNPWIEHYSDLQVYLDYDLIKKNNIDINEIRDLTSSFFNHFEGVQLSLPSYQLEQGNSVNGLLAPLYKSYTKSRSGDFLFILREGWQPSYKFKRINYTDQSHVPLVFYGANITHQKIKQKLDGTDLVPTLSELIEIPIPDKCQGKSIEKVLK